MPSWKQITSKPAGVIPANLIFAIAAPALVPPLLTLFHRGDGHFASSSCPPHNACDHGLFHVHMGPLILLLAAATTCYALFLAAWYRDTRQPPAPPPSS